MARLGLCVLALLVAGGLSDHVKKPADHTSLEHQYKLMTLFFHVQEPNHYKEHQEIAATWDVHSNAKLYTNTTAVENAVTMLWHNWTLPQGVPFSILESTHQYEAVTFFHLLYSAKTYDTFYKTAVYLRPLLNEQLFVYVLSTAIYHRHDTQDIVVPPMYNVFPSFYFNNEIMTTAQRVNTHWKQWVEHYPSTYIWEDNVVIRANETLWPYYNKDSAVEYFTHDPVVAELYSTQHLSYPFWLGQESCPMIKNKRGELIWWWHRQLLARYYMERLSNGLGEIPELDWKVIEEGYASGLSYWNGIAFPSRPDHFHMDSPWMQEKLQEIEEYESRVRSAIDIGFYVTSTGEHVSLRTPEAIDVLGNLIEANGDSPNTHWYKDFISIWKQVLGNSRVQEPIVFYKNIFPLVLPSELELYQTTVRDPAFYMIWKRVLKFFEQWQETLPEYTHEELTVPGVTIEKVDVDKLVSYFEYTHINITNHLYLDEFESKHVYDKKSVLVEIPRLNHKVFTVRVNVKSEASKHVTIKFFLAPKYDSIGREIPLRHNTENFFQFDEFDYTLNAGENVITRPSTEISAPWGIGSDPLEGWELFKKVDSALQGHGQYFLEEVPKVDVPPRRLLLPKGSIGGMPFVLMVYISEYHAPNAVQGSAEHEMSPVGSWHHRLTSDPIGFPLNRPLNPWQVVDLKNIWFHDVQIYHKHTPEIFVTHVL